MSNSATKPLLLWLDLTHDRSVVALIDQFRAACECRLAKSASLPERASEQAVTRLMHDRASQDAPGLCFIGAGAYEHHIPAAVWADCSPGGATRCHPASGGWFATLSVFTSKRPI